MDKYRFVNGVMELNPEWVKAQQAQGMPVPTSTVAEPAKALAIVSTPADAMQAQVMMTPTVMQPMMVMQSQAYNSQFGAQFQGNGGAVIDGLTDLFSRYEIPMGLLDKLLYLARYNLNFIMDDSGSMGSPTDVVLREIHPETRFNVENRCSRGRMQMHDNLPLYRWEEAENRLHIMIDFLQYLPIQNMRISFLNSPQIIQLTHAGKAPQQFAAEAHAAVRAAFTNMANGRTPTMAKLSQAFNTSTGFTMHYFFTDGEPSDASKAEVARLIMTRRNPEMNPLTFVTCTNDDAEAEWMKDIEDKAPFCAEVDDFRDERDEVLRDQGPGFPYSVGFWLLSHLVAAICPEDLDALDESYPMTKRTLDMLLGRRLNPEEYQRYFDMNPNGVRYRHMFQQFCREDVVANQILPELQRIQRPVYQQPPVPGYVTAGLQPPPPPVQQAGMWQQPPMQPPQGVPPVMPAAPQFK